MSEPRHTMAWDEPPLDAPLQEYECQSPLLFATPPGISFTKGEIEALKAVAAQVIGNKRLSEMAGFTHRNKKDNEALKKVFGNEEQ